MCYTGVMKTSKYRLNLYVDPSVINKAKIYAEAEGYTLTTLIEKALKTYIESGTLVNQVLTMADGVQKIKAMSDVYNKIESDIKETEKVS